METNTPDLGSEEKREYLDKHLFEELWRMLGAATEWSVQEQLSLEIVGYDVVVYAMDSVFLRARTLFEFFVKSTNSNHYGCDLFLGSRKVLQSDKYRDWEKPLHRHLMHAQIRSRLKQLESLSGEMKDLNKMPVDFACEVLRLWKEFEKKLDESKDAKDRDLGQLARDKRKEAIKRAQDVVNSKVAQRHASCKGQTLKPVFVFE